METPVDSILSIISVKNTPVKNWLILDMNESQELDSAVNGFEFNQLIS